MSANSESFYATWQVGKPANWHAVLALRAALRVFPLVSLSFDGNSDTSLLKLKIAIIRCLVLSWIARNIPTEEYSAISAVAAISAESALVAAIESNDLRSSSRFAALSTKFALSTAFAAAVAMAANAENGSAQSGGFSVSSIKSAVSAISTINGSSALGIFLKNVSYDCVTLDNWKSSTLSDASITALALWINGISDEINGLYDRGRSQILEVEPNFIVWFDWYERRVRGEMTGFELLPSQDAELSRRLISADNGWWDRDPAEVNANVAAWIVELSFQEDDGVAGLGSATDPLKDFVIDPQSEIAPRFVEDASHRIKIDQHSGVDQLETDEHAMQRHSAVRQRAATVASRLRGHNQAGYIADYAQSLYEALAEKITDGNFAETVLLANRIRQSALQHSTAVFDSDLQQLSPEFVRLVDDLIDAVNMHIGQQAVMAAMDFAILGPDSAITVKPADIITVIDDFELHDIFEERTLDYINATAEMAPAISDPNDRQSRRLSALAANFGRFVVSKVNEYRTTVAGGTIGTATIMFGFVAAAAAVHNGIPYAHFAGITTTGGWIAFIFSNMKKYPDIWMNIAGPSPASRGNMRKILDLIERLWPSERGKKDS